MIFKEGNRIYVYWWIFPCPLARRLHANSGMACKQLENIWELTTMFYTAVRQRFWNIWNTIIVPSTSFTPEGTSVFLSWAKKMLSIPTPASGHSFFCLTAFVVKKKVNIRSQVRNFSHQWSSQMKSRFLLRKGKQKNTAGEFLATCHHVPYMPHPEVTCLVGRSATCQMAHLWTGLEIASIIQRPLDLILMLQASCSGDFQGNPNLATLRIRDMSAGVSKPPVLKPHGLGGFGVSIGGGSGFFREQQKPPFLPTFPRILSNIEPQLDPLTFSRVARRLVVLFCFFGRRRVYGSEVWQFDDSFGSSKSHLGNVVFLKEVKL